MLNSQRVLQFCFALEWKTQEDQEASVNGAFRARE